MKIVMLSLIDYAGSAHKMYSAIKLHTKHKIDLFTGPHENRLGHPLNVVVTNENRSEIQEIVDDADILHFKGDWPPRDWYLGLRVSHKPIVMTTSGSFFRKKQYGGIERYSNADYGLANVKTSFETDLLYPEYSDIWTPHPIDSDDKEIRYNANNIPVFMHIPSSPHLKGTEFVKRVFQNLKQRIKCETHIITGVTFKEAFEAKKRASVYFDQFVVGFYGNSALEAMQYGIPTVCWISHMALEQAKGKMEGCPILNRSQANVEITATKAIEMLYNPDLALKTKRWCDEHHGYKAIASMWDKIYESMI